MACIQRGKGTVLPLSVARRVHPPPQSGCGASVSRVVLRKLLLEPLNRKSPFWGLRLAHGVLVSEHSNLLNRFLNRDGLQPLDGHKIFGAVRVALDAAMIVAFQYVEGRSVSRRRRKLELRSRDGFAFDPADANKSIARRFHPDPISRIQQVQLIAIPGTTSGGYKPVLACFGP